MRVAISTFRRDPAAALGLLAGALLSLLGLSVYIVLPLLTGEQRFIVDALSGAGFHMPDYPLWYHGIVIVLPSSVASLTGTLLLYRFGLTGRVPAIKLLGGIVVVPIVAIVLAYLVAAVVIGVSFGVVGAAEDPVSAIIGVFAFTGLSLIFGLFAVLIAMAFVVPGVILGATTGFVVAYGLRRVSE